MAQTFFTVEHAQAGMPVSPQGQPSVTRLRRAVAKAMGISFSLRSNHKPQEFQTSKLSAQDFCDVENSLHAIAETALTSLLGIEIITLQGYHVLSIPIGA